MSIKIRDIKSHHDWYVWLRSKGLEDCQIDDRDIYMQSGQTLRQAWADEVTGLELWPDGTAALPGLHPDDEDSMGFFRPGAGVIGMSVGGVQVGSLTATELRYTRFAAYPDDTIELQGRVADGASAVALKVGNLNSLSISGSNIQEWYSDNFITRMAYLTRGGSLQLNGGFGFGGAVPIDSDPGTIWGPADIASLIGSGDYANRHMYSDLGSVTSVFYSGNSSGWLNSGRDNYGIGYSSLYGQTSNRSTGVGSFAGNHPGDDSNSQGYSAGRYGGVHTLNQGNNAGRSNPRPNELHLHSAATQEIALFGGNFTSRDVRVDADLYVFNEDSLGSEILTEGDFGAGGASWNVTGSVTDTTGVAVVSGPGTLSQPSGSFASSPNPDRFYKLTYDVSGADGSAVGSVLTSFCDVSTPLVGLKENGTWSTLLRTNGAPGNFDINFTSGICTLDNITLKEMFGGELNVRKSIKLVGDTLDLTNIKSGANQGAAGAATGEVWADTSASNVLKLGV